MLALFVVAFGQCSASLHPVVYDRIKMICDETAPCCDTVHVEQANKQTDEVISPAMILVN